MRPTAHQQSTLSLGPSFCFGLSDDDFFAWQKQPYKQNSVICPNLRYIWLTYVDLIEKTREKNVDSIDQNNFEPTTVNYQCRASILPPATTGVMRKTSHPKNPPPLSPGIPLLLQIWPPLMFVHQEMTFGSTFRLKILTLLSVLMTQIPGDFNCCHVSSTWGSLINGTNSFPTLGANTYWTSVPTSVSLPSKRTTNDE